jgi:MraZ protein
MHAFALGPCFRRARAVRDRVAAAGYGCYDSSNHLPEPTGSPRIARLAADLLVGTTELLASKAPLRLPSRFLPAFAHGGVLTVWLDGCLALWPAAAWASLADRVLRLPLSVADARTFTRVLFASATELDFASGRIPLPDAHRVAAALEDRIVLVGAGDHAELWNPDRWAELTSRDLEELALPTAV